MKWKSEFSYTIFIYLFLNFIYLFEKERAQAQGRDRERDRSRLPLSRKTEAGLVPRSRGSCPQLKADTQTLNHPDAP